MPIDINTFERAWINISENVSCPSVQFSKKTFYVMKDMNTCFVIAELDFTTHAEVQNAINISIPSLGPSYVGDFVPCENTVFALKNDEFNTFVKMTLMSGGTLRLESFPFTPNAKYEMNIQFFFMLRSAENNSFLFQSLID